ncbi:ATP-binding protein [Patescibacteria group bacterium]|nr:ATP-binding protein [Patescibacteria group bacterium]
MQLNLESYIRASQPLVIYETYEPDLAEQHVKTVASRLQRARAEVETYDSLDAVMKALPIVKWLDKQLTSARSACEKADNADNRPVTVAVIRNVQFFLSETAQQRIPMVQWLHNNLEKMKASALVLVGVTSGFSLPEELERIAVIHDSDLPPKNALLNHAMELARDFNEDLRRLGKEPISREQCEEISEIGVGMTVREFKDACTQSLVASRTFDPQVLMALKRQMIRKSEILELVYPGPTDNFAHHKGAEVAKQFIMETFSPKARGVIITGIPGSGKTFLARAIAGELGIPLVVFDLQSVFDMYVGNSEKKIKRALKQIDRFGRSIILLDELEKALRGVGGGGGNNGGGVADNTMAILLKWLQDRPQTGAYIIATTNDAKSVADKAPEYFRPGRWDAIFFMDLPTNDERSAIWDVWLKHYEIADSFDALEDKPDDKDWAGAEIETCCRLSALTGKPPVVMASYICPTMRTAKENILALRKWAETRTVNASMEVVKKTGVAKRLAILDEPVEPPAGSAIEL